MNLRNRSIYFPAAWLLATSCLSLSTENLTFADEIDFNRNIRQILSDNCFLCHGPAESTRKADLRLDDRELALDSGSIEPGNAESSELIARIFSDDPDSIMPPPESKNGSVTRKKKS